MQRITNSYRDLGLDNTLKLIKMENKELKAIDANEKKRIVKLNQSTILPGSVRIKVQTLTEAPEEIIPQDEVLPEIVTAGELEEE